MLMMIDPVEVIGSTLGYADKANVEIGYGTELGSLNGSLEVSNDGITYGSFIGDSLLHISDRSFDGLNDVPTKGEFLADPFEEASCGEDSWILLEAFLRMAPEEMQPICSRRGGGCGEGLQGKDTLLRPLRRSVSGDEGNADG